MPLFSVSRLSISRGKGNQRKTLLDEVSFSVKRGEYLAVIGPNGAGKSTLLKCLGRLLTGWTGEILFDNVPLRQWENKHFARRSALVQQNPPVVFGFTVRQIVEMGRYPYLKPLSPVSEEDRNIVEQSLEIMDITHLAERAADTLSGGELQKVQLATALTQQADVLLLDEPTTYLDYKHQSGIGRLLRSLNQEHGKTVIEVTHDVNRAVLDATHVIAVSSGKTVFDGSPQYLMEPEHLRNIYDVDFQMVEHPVLPLKLVVPGL
ncbi:iron-dicitrate ABC transporter ATP-binding protein [Planctomycetales bacterium]|nr:iron-dicitrate ABC transporter ATP-binding protein [Planctomycetales bacterium]